MISSVTVPSISRVIRSLTRRSSGPTPAIGLMAPPSTWYLPRNSRVRSMATTSLGSSTTQMVSGERRGSRQMRHCGSCATFPQISQNRTRSLTSVSASASRRTSAGSADSRWNAMRWALLGPTPGSRPSSSIRSWTAPSYTSEARQTHATHARGERAELVLRHRLGLGRRVTNSGDDEVLQGLDVVGVDDRGRELDAQQLAGAGDGRLGQPAGRLAGDLQLGQL